MTKSIVKDTKRLRPKDLVKVFLRTNIDMDRSLGSHLLYEFAYWMEGQDLWEDDNPDNPNFRCRYHVVPAHEAPCPFTEESERNEIEAHETRNNL